MPKIRQNPGFSAKLGLSNASSEVSIEVLAQLHGQRFWIERVFEDAKSEVGMAQYQLRGWTGWHNHMALCALALLFLLRVRLLRRDEDPLLSARDIRCLLEHFLPQRVITGQDVIDQIQRRHQRRRRATKAAKRRQGDGGA